jgi:hypothetical protein
MLCVLISNKIGNVPTRIKACMLQMIEIYVMLILPILSSFFSMCNLLHEHILIRHDKHMQRLCSRDYEVENNTIFRVNSDVGQQS